MYKDKEKQKAANRLASQRRRAKGMTQGMTNQGMTGVSVTGMTITDNPTPLPVNFGQPDCQCRHCQNNRKTGGHMMINHGPYKSIGELGKNEINRVSLPGDVDYQVAELTVGRLKSCVDQMELSGIDPDASRLLGVK